MKFNAKLRDVQGSSASRRLRRAGSVPGIVYGGKGEAVSIELDHNQMYHAVRKSEFHASVLEMNLDGKVENVLLRAVQWHPYKQQVLHIDFQRVEAGQAITTKVPLTFINADLSPAVKLHGENISHVLNEIEITCLPKDLPVEIVVDLAELESAQVVHLGSVKAPKGVTFVAPAEEVLASAVAPKGPKGEAADSAEGEAAAE